MSGAEGGDRLSSFDKDEGEDQTKEPDEEAEEEETS